ncbi:MAG: BON domain-containing protein [Nostocaceae cyanobacterium]|nr:BON domain-containing protein [Nostocaceae cyanobacterium]
MKKILLLITNGLILVGAFGCQNIPNPRQPGTTTQPLTTTTNQPVTTTNQPVTTTTNQPVATTTNQPVTTTTQPVTTTTTQPVANTNQRENTTATNNLRSTILAKLENRFPSCSLTVNVTGNDVLVTGTVSQETDSTKIRNLVSSISGVNNVNVKVRIASS